MSDAFLFLRRLLGVADYGLPLAIGAVAGLGIMGAIKVFGPEAGLAVEALTNDPGAWVYMGMLLGVGIGAIRDRRLLPDQTRAWLNAHEAILDRAGVKGEEREKYWRQILWQASQRFPGLPVANSGAVETDANRGVDDPDTASR